MSRDGRDSRSAGLGGSLEILDDSWLFESLDSSFLVMQMPRGGDVEVGHVDRFERRASAGSNSSNGSIGGIGGE